MRKLAPFLLLTLIACQDPNTESVHEDSDPPSEQPAGRLQAGPPLALSSVVDRAELRFEPDGTGYRAGFATHEARIHGDALVVSPKHWNGTETISGAPITFATSSLARGDVELDPGIVATVPHHNRIELIRPGSTERIENQPEGLEQSWTFGSLPQGDGDLTIHVMVSGFRDVSTNARGIHFSTPGRLGVVYSHAVWRDSSGAEWPITSEWDGATIALTVPERVLESSVFPAVLDPTIGSEAAVDTLTTGFTGEFARETAAAFSGTNFLVVWRDDRSGTNSDIFGARVSPAGVVLDQFGLAVNTGTGIQTKPAVAWVGSKWLVVWSNNGNIEAATVPASGAPIIQLGVVEAGNASLPAIAARGTQALITWQSGLDVRGSVFNGTSFGAGFAIAATAADEVDPAVGANPAGDYLVTWTEGTTAQDVKAQRVTSAGAMNGTAIVLSNAAGVQSETSVAFTGTDFITTWTDRNDLFGTRVSTAGVVLDTHVEGVTTLGGVAVSTAAGAQVTSTVACDPASCLVVWADRRAINTNGFDLFGQRMSFAMAPIGAEITVSAPQRAQIGPSIAAGTSGWLAVWEDGRTGGPSAATGARIDTAGAVLDATGIPLNLNHTKEVEPAISIGTTTGLAVWSDSRAFGNDIMATRYNTSGNAIDSSARTVSNATGQQSTPAVSFDGTQHVVVWSDNRNPLDDDIFAARFDNATGVTLDPAGIAISTAANRQLVPDIASGGGVSLIVWQDRRNASATGFDIIGALLAPDGTILLNDIAISNATGDQTRPAVTFDPNSGGFVVVWSDNRVAGNADIFGSRVTTAGVVLDAAGVQISNATAGQFAPDVAVSGTQLLVVWDDRRNETVGDIFGTRLTTAGALTVLDAAGLAIGTIGGQSAPTVIGTAGGNWAVAWTDSRNSVTNGTDIIGADVTSAGALLGEFSISTGVEDEQSPKFMNNPNTALTASLVYQRLRTDLRVQRVFRRVLTYTAAQGTTCSKDAQCTSGFCVDGFCCDQACGGTQTKYPLDCQACSVAKGAASNGTCGIVTAGRVCRGYAGGNADLQCDVQEVCNGVDPTCPADLGRNAGIACTGLCGTGVCPPNDVSGAPHFCDCP